VTVDPAGSGPDEAEVRAAAQEEVDALLARAKRAYLPIFLVSGAAFMGAAWLGYPAVSFAIFGLALVASLGWNIWFARWRRGVERRADEAVLDPSRPAPARRGVAARRGVGLRLFVSAVPVSARSSEPVDVVSRRLAEGVAVDGATVTDRPGPTGGRLRATDRLRHVRNEVHLVLDGSVRWEPPGETVFTGSIRAAGQGRFVGAIAVLFLVAGTVAVLSTPVRLAVQTDRAGAWFVTFWGLVGIVIGISFALTYARGAEPYLRAVAGAFGHRATIGRRAPS
jgi:hypothetical protein